MKQFVQFVGLATCDGGLFVYQALLHHFHGDAHHSCTGTLTVTRLEEPEFAFLYGKFHVLHVVVVVFQLRLQFVQLLVDFGHGFFHGRIFAGTLFLADALQLSPALRADFRDLLRRADAGHHVFALCVDEVLAVEEVFARSSIAAEAYARSGCVAHVAEHHGLHVDSRAPFIGYAFHLAVEDGAFVHPRVEHGANGAPQLFVGIRREFLARDVLHGFLEFLYQRLQVFHVQLVVQTHAFGLLHLLDDGLERVDVVLVGGFHTQHHVAIHLHEATVGVPCEAFVARLASQSGHYFVVQAEVEDSVHHAGHGCTCTRTYGNEQRVLHVAELRVHQAFNHCDGFLHVIFQYSHHAVLSFFIIFGADFGGDGEARRNGHSNKVHFS